MNGMTMFRPGSSVLLNLPNRSITHAFCCGTILIVLNARNTANTPNTMTNISMLFSSSTSYFNSISEQRKPCRVRPAHHDYWCVGRTLRYFTFDLAKELLDDQTASGDILDTPHLPGCVRLSFAGQFGIPLGAAIADPGMAFVRPIHDMHGLADVIGKIGLAVQVGLLLPPEIDPPHADRAQHRRDDCLRYPRNAQIGCQTRSRQPERHGDQIERAAEHLGYHQHHRRQPPDPISFHPGTSLFSDRCILPRLARVGRNACGSAGCIAIPPNPQRFSKYF